MFYEFLGLGFPILDHTSQSLSKGFLDRKYHSDSTLIFHGLLLLVSLQQVSLKALLFSSVQFINSKKRGFGGTFGWLPKNPPFTILG